MWLLDNEGELDPARNLALEEYALRTLDPERSFLLLYVNRPSVVIGKNQNAFEEANLQLLRQRGTPLLRRISGGGTVYHDLGNLNFSFISRFERGTLLSTRDRLDPIVEQLRALGAAVEFGERDDIFLDGCKISGNAQFTTTQRTLAHGTLLYDSDLQQIKTALTPKDGRFASRATASRRSPVTNLRPHVADAAPDMASLCERLTQALLGTAETARSVRRLTNEEWGEVDRLAQERYRSWEWNFGRFREFELQRRRTIDAASVEMTVEVEHGTIRRLRLRGDGLPAQAATGIESPLAGVRYEAEAILAALSRQPPSFGTIDAWCDLIA